MRHDALYIATLAGIGLILTIGSCRSKQTWDDPGPKATFRQYLMHWFHGESQQAFEMIAPEDRDRLTRPLESLRETLDEDSLPETHEMLIAGRVDNPYDIKSMEASPTLESRPDSGTTVTLDLEYHDQRTGRARVVWRDDRWYVALPLDRGSVSEGSGPPESTARGESAPDASAPPDAG